MPDNNIEEKYVTFDGPNDERTKCREEARIKFEKILSDMEDKIKHEIDLARSRGEIYIEQPDIGYWKIHDKDGYYAGITTDDWKHIRKCLNEMDRGKSEVFLNEMVYTIMDIMCHECKQKCDRCRVNDLLHALYRRLPYQEEGEY